MGFALFWLLALGAALLLLVGLFPQGDDRAFEDAALGDQTQTVIGMFDGDRVHCFTLVDGDECLGPAAARGLDRTLLWLGNSQLHAINQLRDGDLLASVLLADSLRQEGVEVLTFSQPNANLREHLVLFEAITARQPVSMVLISAVFDDTREGGIRAAMSQLLHMPEVAVRLGAHAPGQEILATIEDTQPPETGPETLQERSEVAITDALEFGFGWESLRARARGTVALSLYKTRNTVFGITASTIRRKIPATYDANLAALDQLLISAADQGIEVLVYIPPLRSDVTPPYDPGEYATFKADIETMARTRGAGFANIEGVVPGPLWGVKASTNVGTEPEYDFMHFQGQGHVLLAEALLPLLSNTEALGR